MSESKDIKPTLGLSSDSKERWTAHAITKLSKGYKLIVSKTRKVANFHKGYGDYETCPHHAALRLIKEGLLVEVGEQPLGIVYELKPEFVEHNPFKKKIVKKVLPKLDDDDLDDDDLGDDDLGDDLDVDVLDDDLDDDIDEEETKDDEDSLAIELGDEDL